MVGRDRCGKFKRAGDLGAGSRQQCPAERSPAVIAVNALIASGIGVGFSRRLGLALIGGCRLDGQRTVANHPPTIAAGGVGRIAQVQQPQHQAVAARGPQRAVQRRVAAGLVTAQIVGKAEDALHRAVVVPARLRSRQAVRRVGTDDDQGLVAAPQTLEPLVNGLP